VCTFGGGRFAVGGTEKSVILYGGEEHGWREVSGPASMNAVSNYRRQLSRVEDTEIDSSETLHPVQESECTKSFASSFATSTTRSSPMQRKAAEVSNSNAVAGMSLYDLLHASDKTKPAEVYADPMPSLMPADFTDKDCRSLRGSHAVPDAS